MTVKDRQTDVSKNMLSKADKIKSLKENYRIKGDGAVVLNLAKAVKTKEFRESFNKIKNHKLELANTRKTR